MTSPAAPARLRFGRFELQPDERRLLVDGAPAALGARAFDLLLALAERPGRLVAKSALMDIVWPGLVVQENNLAAQVSALRKVLGGDVIGTVPGRGYRLVVPVEAAAPCALPPAPQPRDDAARAAPAPRTNLPVELPALLGRASELQTLGELVARHRLVSVVGTGGLGKSLLVQHLLDCRRGDHAQGVCWVELAAPGDAAALPGAIASALGVHVGPGEPLDALIGAVASLDVLLALDNAEHMVAEVARVCQALHDAAPALRLVVTSQAPLRLAAERVLRIAPLALPDGPLPAAQALAFGAVALFAERAHAADGRFALTDDNAPAVVEVCRALDGLPLAIELAAARAPLLGVAGLLASMPERLKLLTASRHRAAPARQQTLRAALEWSHGLLAPREQQVFRRLGVVAGSAALGLVQAVAGDDGALDDWAVLDALDLLVDRSLVTVLATGDAGAPRYRLLESPRAYALEQLDAAGERADVQRRHALELAERFDAAYDDCFDGRAGVDEWLRRLEPDLDNARDALAWARASGDARVHLAIGATLLRALPPSLHAERLALADACEALADAPVPERLQQRAWLELSCAWADTQKTRSRDAAQRALALARRLDAAQAGDRFTLYLALCRAASAAAQAGDPPAAAEPLQALRVLERPTWPAQRLVWGAEAEQVMARHGGDRGEALARMRRLHELDRQRGSDATIVLGNLIDAELAAGDAAAAERSGRALVAALLGTRHEYSLALARLNLCAASLARDDVGAAREVAAAAWPQARAFDMQHVAAAYLAELAALEQRPRTAARLHGYAAAAYAARDETPEANEAAALARARGASLAALGEPESARLEGEGRALHDEQVAALGFARADALP